MSNIYNRVVETYLSVEIPQLTVTLNGPPDPPPPVVEFDGSPQSGFLWTIHPRRRLHALLDQKRHRNPFRRLSVNTDFRAWRRVVRYTTGPGVVKVIEPPVLLCEMTYEELEATGMTYAELEATGKTYGEVSECEPIIV